MPLSWSGDRPRAARSKWTAWAPAGRQHRLPPSWRHTLSSGRLRLLPGRGSPPAGPPPPSVVTLSTVTLPAVRISLCCVPCAARPLLQPRPGQVRGAEEGLVIVTVHFPAAKPRPASVPRARSSGCACPPLRAVQAGGPASPCVHILLSEPPDGLSQAGLRLDRIAPEEAPLVRPGRRLEWCVRQSPASRPPSACRDL